MNCVRFGSFIRRYHWKPTCWTTICIPFRQFNPFRNHYTTWYHTPTPSFVGIGGASIEDDIRRSLDVESEQQESCSKEI